MKPMALQQRQRSIRTYSESQLFRKIRDEKQRWPVVDEDTPSEQMCRHVRIRHLAALMKAAKLTPVQRKAFILCLNGASVRDLANILRISGPRVYRLLSVMRRKLSNARTDRYYGLHEVYWQEVRRYVYRKPRSLQDSKKTVAIG
jgi:DNA-directed RNA polymerase specialized sigma24 family protein